jgi:hypothetical protein
MTVIYDCGKSMKNWIRRLIEKSVERRAYGVEVVRIADCVLKKDKYGIRNTKYGIGLPFLLAWVLLVACGGQTPLPPSRPTGIAVAPLFVDFHDRYGGTRVMGYPITEPFLEPATGRTIQYFQTMRLEYEPTRPEAERVVVAALGEWAFEGVTIVTPAPTSTAGEIRYFDQNLFVQDEFLAFYEAYQGEQLFGRPISLQFDEGGKQVQYFRNVRLEWDPNQPPEFRIQVSRLGEAHFEESGAMSLYEAQGGFGPVFSAGVREVTVTVDVTEPVLYGQEPQVVQVEVHDLRNRPVEGIEVILLLMYNGQTITLEGERTDAEGRVERPIDVTDAERGVPVEVVVQVKGDNGEVIGGASVSFRPWWE